MTTPTLGTAFRVTSEDTTRMVKSAVRPSPTSCVSLCLAAVFSAGSSACDGPSRPVTAAGPLDAAVSNAAAAPDAAPTRDLIIADEPDLIAEGNGRSPPTNGVIEIDQLSTWTAGRTARVYTYLFAYLRFPVCPTTTLGACTYHWPCTSDIQGERWLSVGDVTIRGGRPDPLSLAVQQGAIYPSLQLPRAVFEGGESLQFLAAGGVVPAFTTVLTAPRPPTVTAPAFVPLNGGVGVREIDRTQDLVFIWSGVTTETIEISLYDNNAGFVCEVAGNAGGFTVPKATVAYVLPGPGHITVQSVARAHLTPGLYDLSVIVTAGAITEEGVGYTGPVILK